MPTDPTGNRAAAVNSPLGASLADGGAHFRLFSRHATGVELLLFDHVDDATPARRVRFDPAARAYHYWHAFVPGVKPGQIYGYNVQGPNAPDPKLRFDSSKLLLDPYGLAVAMPKEYRREAA